MDGKAIDSVNNDSVILDDMLIVSGSPHIKSEDTVRRIMLDAIIALVPVMIGAIYYFGFNAVRLLLVTVLATVTFEYGIQKLFKKKIRIMDLSAVVTGILLALNLPAGTPWWVAVFGAGFAIIIVKECFGGIGSNFMNPALGARAAIVASWPAIMTNYLTPDGISAATPLTIMKSGGANLPSIQRMFFGDIGGVIGETSAVLILIGGLYLIIRQVINWKIPALFISSAALSLLLFGVNPANMPYQILGGSLIFGAFFFATDYSSSPVTPKGKVIFALGCGILTAVIRVKGGLPEGVSYAILLMNVATPLIEKYTQPKVFGEVK